MRRLHCVSELLFEATVDCQGEVQELYRVMTGILKQKGQFRVLVASEPYKKIQISETFKGDDQ